MITFIEIPLADPNHLNEHDQLAECLEEGWQIIGHSVYTYDSEPMERYTLYRKAKNTHSIIEEAEELLAEPSIDAIVSRAKHLGMGSGY